MAVVHVDHGMRPGSDRDAALVQQVAADTGVPCEVVRVDVVGYARVHRMGLEHAARVLRYRAIADASRREGGALVATGHTADDSVESVLMNLVRGTGLEGLRGIAARQMLELARLGPSEDPPVAHTLDLVRPLLPLTRADTIRYCQSRGLPWAEDPTNLDPRFLRNRVRHHLLPTLRTYNPRIDRALLQTAELVRDEDAWLERLVERAWRRTVRPGHGGVALHIPTLLRQPLAARRRLIRRALSHLEYGESRFGFGAISRTLSLLDPDSPGRIQLAERVVAVRDGDLIRMQDEARS